MIFPNFREDIISADKYLSIFSRQIEAIVFWGFFAKDFSHFSWTLHSSWESSQVPLGNRSRENLGKVYFCCVFVFFVSLWDLSLLPSRLRNSNSGISATQWVVSLGKRGKEINCKINLTIYVKVYVIEPACLFEFCFCFFVFVFADLYTQPRERSIIKHAKIKNEVHRPAKKQRNQKNESNVLQ